MSALVESKTDLRIVAPSVEDQVGEWLATQALALQGLHPFEVEPRDGDVLPAPHEDRYGNKVDAEGGSAGDSVYFLTNANPTTLGVPVMRPGLFNGQRVRFSPVSAAVTLPAGSARGAGASVSIAPGGDVTLLWDAPRGVWTLAGGTGSGGGGGVAPETLVAAVAITAGWVVVLDTITGQVRPANADFSLGRFRVAGIAVSSAAAGQPVDVFTVVGVLTPGRFAAAPPAAANRRYVFLDDTDGLMTLTPPDISTPGRVRHVVGLLQGADDSSVTPTILYQPRYVSRRP